MHNGSADLEDCLNSLTASDFTRDQWELIVVDDASTDTSREIAERYADSVISIPAPARGPAYARNRGIETATSPITVFVDADVTVHSDALRLLVDDLEREEIAAVFGSYDDRPFGTNVVSQYRNLLHHFVHQRAAGDVESFWAGCGAAKKETLVSIGVFDEDRFRRPEIEDVELGYRLRDAGHRILLDPAVQCAHHKRISLPQMIAGDFSRRGVPWTRLLLDRRMLTAPRGLSLGISERLSSVAAVIFAVNLIAAPLRADALLVIIAACWLGVFVTANHELFALLARRRGAAFLFAAIPLHLIYSLVAFGALIWGTLTHPFSRTSQARYKPRR